MKTNEVIKRLNYIKEVDISVSNNQNCCKEIRNDAADDAVALDFAIRCVKTTKNAKEEFYKGLGITCAFWILLLLTTGIWRLI